MQATERKEFPYSWEQAIEILRSDPDHQQLIFDSYLTADLEENCRRFARSDEFREILRLLRESVPGARRVLDMPGGNGIATYALAGAGFDVTTVEPNPSASVGRGAIAHVLGATGLQARVVDAWGESLPFEADSFDAVFVRQGLHHAADLAKMLAEIGRVLRPGGALLACREHVVDDYGPSLAVFLDSQVDHQLYGGEHAFMLDDYIAAIRGAGFELRLQLGPFESAINLHPNTPEVLRRKILASSMGRALGFIMPERVVVALGKWRLQRQKKPGRLYTFLCVKPGGAVAC